MQNVSLWQYAQVSWPSWILAGVIWTVMFRTAMASLFMMFIQTSRGQSVVLSQYIDEMQAANKRHDLDTFDLIHRSLALYIQRPQTSNWTRAIIALVIFWAQVAMAIVTWRLVGLGINHHYFGV